MFTHSYLYSSSVIAPSCLYIYRSLLTLPFKVDIGFRSICLYTSSFDRWSLHFSLHLSESITTKALSLSAGTILIILSFFFTLLTVVNISLPRCKTVVTPNLAKSRYMNHKIAQLILRILVVELYF